MISFYTSETNITDKEINMKLSKYKSKQDGLSFKPHSHDNLMALVLEAVHEFFCMTQEKKNIRVPLAVGG